MSPLAYPRRSFVYRRLLAAQMSFSDMGDACLPRCREKSESASGLKIVDLSVVPRWGLKGRDAHAWLAARGAVTPNQNNTAELQADGSLIARLSPGEALVLAPVHGRAGLASAIESLPPQGEGACYPVPRRDSHGWFLVVGDDAPKMLAKLCAVDFSPGEFPERRVAQTSVARLSSIVIRHDMGSLAFSILAESASAEYLWDCLLDAMAEFSGAVCGVEAVPAGDC